MTVIAWDGKTLAADGLMTYGDSIGSTRQQKIFRAADYDDKNWNVCGYFVQAFAITGMIGGEQVLIPILNDSLYPEAEITANSNFTAFIVLENGETWICGTNSGEKDINLYRVDMPHFALGCGADAALGALIAGRNAIDAVAIAMDVNVYCGGEIQRWTPLVSHPNGETRFATNVCETLWLSDEVN